LKNFLQQSISIPSETFFAASFSNVLMASSIAAFTTLNSSRIPFSDGFASGSYGSGGGESSAAQRDRSVMNYEGKKLWSQSLKVKHIPMRLSSSVACLALFASSVARWV
jgi:hypothetical protein